MHKLVSIYKIGYIFCYRWDNDFTKLPKYLCESKADYVSDKENFLKGVKW